MAPCEERVCVLWVASLYHTGGYPVAESTLKYLLTTNNFVSAYRDCFAFCGRQTPRTATQSVRILLFRFWFHSSITILCMCSCISTILSAGDSMRLLWHACLHIVHVFFFFFCWFQYFFSFIAIASRFLFVVQPNLLRLRFLFLFRGRVLNRILCASQSIVKCWTQKNLSAIHQSRTCGAPAIGVEIRRLAMRERERVLLTTRFTNGVCVCLKWRCLFCFFWQLVGCAGIDRHRRIVLTNWRIGEFCGSSFCGIRNKIE